MLTFVFNELAAVVTFPEGFENGLVRIVIVLANEIFQISSGFRSIVYEEISPSLSLADQGTYKMASWGRTIHQSHQNLVVGEKKANTRSHSHDG